MKLIDWERKGQAVRLYFGDDALTDWGGDDWNDAPYEHNAGNVYGRYICHSIDVFFPFSAAVMEPSDGALNSQWCKDDMVARKVPCLVVLRSEDTERYWRDVYSYDQVSGDDNALRIYLGDEFCQLTFALGKMGAIMVDTPKGDRWWANEES